MSLDVSVVIPTRNRPERLQACLEHILAGERLPLEIIVCDQSDDDATWRVLARIASDAPRLQYCRLNRPNASLARNAGLQRADGYLIAYIDDDCLASPRWLAALVAAYERINSCELVTAVTGRVLPLTSPGRNVPVSSRASPEARIYRRPHGKAERNPWAPWDLGTGGNLLVPRPILLQIGGFDPMLGPGSSVYAAEDIDLLYRLAGLGTVVYESQALVYHPAVDRRQRLGSRFRYGAGMGAMLAKHVRLGNNSARALVALYVRHQGANMLRRGAWGTLEAILTLIGAASGAAKVWARSRRAGRRQLWTRRADSAETQTNRNESAKHE